jgi:hypothetical protein
MKSLFFIVLIANTLLAKIAFAGSIEGHVVDLNDKAVGGVTVRAFEVNPQGVRSPNAFNSAVSESSETSFGKYKLDLMNKRRVVLLFSGQGSNDVFVPQPQQENANVGGAISGLKDIFDFDVIVPAAKSIHPPICCAPCRRCHWCHR